MGVQIHTFEEKKLFCQSQENSKIWNDAEIARKTEKDVDKIVVEDPLTLKGPEGGTWCPPLVIQSIYSIEMMIRSMETLCKFIFACLRPIEKKTERSIYDDLILAAFGKPIF